MEAHRAHPRHVGQPDSGNTLATVNRGDGILIEGSHDNEVLENEVSDVGQYGIHLIGQGTRNTVRDNQVSGAQVGIMGSNGQDNTITESTASGNTTYELQDLNGICLNTWIRNTFETRNPDCIR